MGKYVADNEKFEKCVEFFYELAEILHDRYNVVSSCNNDASAYLVPNGTEDQISYTSKPYYSFRVSDHWNWYENTKKCPMEWYVQCLSQDMPRAKKREIPGKASSPRMGMQVCIFGTDKKYNCVYGEFFDRKTQTLGWIESDPAEVAKKYA